MPILLLALLLLLLLEMNMDFEPHMSKCLSKPKETSKMVIWVEKIVYFSVFLFHLLFTILNV